MDGLRGEIDNSDIFFERVSPCDFVQQLFGLVLNEGLDGRSPFRVHFVFDLVFEYPRDRVNDIPRNTATTVWIDITGI